MSPLARLILTALIISACGIATIAMRAEMVGDSAITTTRKLGEIDTDKITEASGMTLGAVNKDVLWVHNDSGDEARIYALSGKGRLHATYLLQGASAYDWEDMARSSLDGTAYLYIGDIGDNFRARSSITIYRVKEPPVDLKETGASKEIESVDTMFLEYPGEATDAETVIVPPESEYVYIVDKAMSQPQANVYKARFKSSHLPQKLERIAQLKLPGTRIAERLITAGDISPDGRRVVLSTYACAYELVLPAEKSLSDFDEIWKQKPKRIELPALKQIESICYARDGKSLLVTTEGKRASIYQVPLKPEKH